MKSGMTFCQRMAKELERQKEVKRDFIRTHHRSLKRPRPITPPMNIFRKEGVERSPAQFEMKVSSHGKFLRR